MAPPSRMAARTRQRWRCGGTPLRTAITLCSTRSATDASPWYRPCVPTSTSISDWSVQMACSSTCAMATENRQGDKPLRRDLDRLDQARGAVEFFRSAHGGIAEREALNAHRDEVLQNLGSLIGRRRLKH